MVCAQNRCDPSPLARPGGGEKPIDIPVTYNTETNIVKDVKKGENVIDLEIKTK
jgi:hypothetical protein